MLKLAYTILTALIVAAVLAGGGALFIFYQYGRGLPDYTQLANYEPPIITRLHSKDGRLFAEYASEKRIFVPIEVIPERIRRTFLAAEDKNFYEHPGLDFFGIARAFFTNIQRLKENKRPIGASTITQQVAKNFLLYDISNVVSYERKIKEAILTFRIENTFTKDHILELYLNEIYLGSGSYGVAAAALNYFNKSLESLTISEAAFLAALPKAPSRYDPVRAPNRAKGRRDWVITRMVEDGLITQEEGIEAIRQPINIRRKDPTKVVHAAYFAEEVRRELYERFGEKTLYEGGLRVRTTLDPRLQQIADRTLREGLITYDRRHGWRGPIVKIPLTAPPTKVQEADGNPLPGWAQRLATVARPAGSLNWKLAVVIGLDNQAAKIGFTDGATGTIPLSELKWARHFYTTDRKGPAISNPREALSEGDVILVDGIEETDQEGTTSRSETTYKLCQIPSASGGLVVMDPHTGRVLALSGGYSFELSQFNRVTQAWRQPGSAFKPFVYLAAMEQGLTPSTRVVDAPIAVEMGYGLGLYKPKNFDDKFLGPVTLRTALERSRNTVTVRMVHDIIGMKPVVEVSQRFGINENLPMQLAMLLGAGETTLLKLSSAYAMIANGGKKLYPTLIERVQDRKGRTILLNKNRTCKGCVTEPWMGQNPPLLNDNREYVTEPGVAYQLTAMMQNVGARVAKRIGKEGEEPRPLAGKTGTTQDYRDALFVGYSPDLVVGVFVGFDEPRTLGDKEYGVQVAEPIFAEFIKEALKDTPPTPFRTPPGIRFIRVNRHTGAMTHAEDPDAILEAFRPGSDPPAEPVEAHGEGEDDDDRSGASMTGTGGIY